MLEFIRLPKLGEIGRERLKRGVLLVIGCGVILAGVKLLGSKKMISSASIPISKEQLVDLGGKVLDKALNVLGKRTGGEEESGDSEDKKGVESRETAGEVAGAVQEVTSKTQVVIEKTVEEKVKEIMETIKNLPEEQAERIRKEVMKEICEEICETR